MKRWFGHGVALGSLLALLASCKFETKATPATQLVVDVDAETLIRNRLESLRVVVQSARHRDNIDERETVYDEPYQPNEFDPEARRWPVRFVLTPSDGDARRVFELTATALGSDDRFVAQARIVTGYIANQIRYTRLVLETECFEVECEDLQTCRVGGCTDAFIEPEDLPLLPGPNELLDGGEGGVPEGGPEPDAETDSGMDAGPDAEVDSGPPPIDPCLIDNGGCDVRTSCQTIEGVPTCGQCPGGFVDVNGNGSRCEDVDECSDNKGGCDPDHGICVNTAGGRDCSCEAGWNGNGRECTANVPCAEDASVCHALASCQEIDGQRLCQCNSNYEGDGGSCQDIDECMRGLHNCPAHSTCTNTQGSFDCKCVDGYTMAGSVCTDVNECLANTDNCDDMPNACQNVDGTFMCQCPGGYMGSGVGDTCADMNECMDDLDTCDDMPDACVNTTGSYMCACPPGYRGTGRESNGCTEIDECTDLVTPDDCDGDPNACVNLIGGVPGFMCDCPDGYSGDGLGDNGCVQVNECLMPLLNTCDTDPAACVDDIGGTPGHHCDCPDGYSGDGVGAGGCVDIDECTSITTPDDCNSNATCNGAMPAGSFSCTCNAGFTGDGHGAGGCTDINECTSVTTPDNCDGDPNACMNLIGGNPGFMCDCPDGYSGNGQGDNGCVQMNECSQAGTHNCDTDPLACVDDVGGDPGYHCDCPDGFAGNGVGAGGCTDIDECTSMTFPDDCNANATCNGALPAGSFTCTCLPGYTGNGHGAGGCTDIDECSSSTTPDDCSPNATCNGTTPAGSFTCTCMTGFTGTGHGPAGCVDTNNCTPNPCMNSGTCTETAPGADPAFTCACPCGFMGTNCGLSVPITTLGLSGVSGPSAPFTGANTIAAVPINVGAATSLVGFKIGSGSGSANVRMGLYRDDGGVPGALEAQSESVPLATAATRIALAGNPAACHALAAGDYWIAITGDAAFDVGSGGSAISRYSRANAFGALPTPFSDVGNPATAGSGDNLVLQLITTP